MSKPSIRRYRADFIKDAGGVGIGITEHGGMWDKETIAVHSLYVDKEISNKEASLIIFQRIFNELEEGEGAILQMNRYSFRKQWDKPYRAVMNVQFIETFRGRIKQTNTLAHDAIRRQSDISEVFEEPMCFDVIELEKEEIKEKGDD